MPRNKKASKAKKPTKIESVEEYLARGGKVTQLPYIPPQEDVSYKSQSQNNVPTMMTLGEGALYYSEIRSKNKKSTTKKVETINVDALPSHLLKFVPNQ